jgi:lactoylglutathione lyase
MKDFYVKYFNCTSDGKYINPKKFFESYFINFSGETKLELMYTPSIPENYNTDELHIGIIHVAISVGSRNTVAEITDKLQKDGYGVVSNPRETGDGFFESSVLDPEGYRIEITI